MPQPSIVSSPSKSSRGRVRFRSSDGRSHYPLQ
ncbi:hypothetical protein LINGRAHAP2_LOCUS20211 [Linum grandiflorum]